MKSRFKKKLQSPSELSQSTREVENIHQRNRTILEKNFRAVAGPFFSGVYVVAVMMMRSGKLRPLWLVSGRSVMR